MQGKQGVGLTDGYGNFSAELQTLLLIQISKTKAINAQFGPFSRDNLTPQTLILILLASFYINIGKLRSKQRV